MAGIVSVMKLPAKYQIRIPPLLPIATLCALVAGIGPSAAAQKPKLPRPRVLENEVRVSRDPATGDMRTIPAAEGEPAGPELSPLIRSRVALVEVQCTVTGPDGVRVRGL